MARLPDSRLSGENLNHEALGNRSYINRVSGGSWLAQAYCAIKPVHARRQPISVDVDGWR